MVQTIAMWCESLPGTVFQYAVQPLLFHCGLIAHDEAVFDALYTVLLGSAEIAVLYLLVRPLEALWPAEPWPHRREARADVLYTWLHRLGVFSFLGFLLFTPLEDMLDSWLHGHHLMPSSLEDWLPILPRNGLLTFCVYLVVHDFLAYWLHRAQHTYAWWWALHSLHHSQRQMSFWADDRNHLLDDLLLALILAAVARLIGIPPAQFVTLTVLTRAVESLSHANIRLSFGAWGVRLLVGPRFHRVHHAIGAGHEGPAHGCNFAELFPVWDIMFGTADFQEVALPTGVRDQLAGRDYGSGFWQQQWFGLQRLAAALAATRHRWLRHTRWFTSQQR